jgi:hypothetical protein
MYMKQQESHAIYIQIGLPVQFGLLGARKINVRVNRPLHNVRHSTNPIVMYLVVRLRGEPHRLDGVVVQIQAELKPKVGGCRHSNRAQSMRGKKLHPFT